MSHSDSAKPQFEKVLEHLAHELNAIRTGRANPSILDDVQVEAYGAFQPVKALAAISTPDARTIKIDPWDGSVVQAIEQAIQKSDIGIQPVVDGKSLRLTMPMMTDETRQKMVKIMKEKLEEGRVGMRKVREETRKKMSAEDGGEDALRREQEALEKIVKDYMAKIDVMGEKKEKEITTL